MLGRYLMDHFTVEGAGGLMPSLRSSKREATGRPCGFLIPKYVNAAGAAQKDRNSRFLRGYRFDGDGSQELYGHAFLMPSSETHGASACAKRSRTTSRSKRKASACRSRENFVALDPKKKDAWGIPVLHINASYGENEKAMAAAMRDDIAAILDAMKLTDVTPPNADISVFGKNIHECGTARMGTDPKKSVVDANCKVHDAPQRLRH